MAKKAIFKMVAIATLNYKNFNSWSLKASMLKTNKSPGTGIDFVGSRMLIELSSVIYDFVADLFIKSLNIGNVP